MFYTSKCRFVNHHEFAHLHSVPWDMQSQPSDSAEGAACDQDINVEAKTVDM